MINKLFVLLSNYLVSFLLFDLTLCVTHLCQILTFQDNKLSLVLLSPEQDMKLFMTVVNLIIIIPHL